MVRSRRLGFLVRIVAATVATAVVLAIAEWGCGLLLADGSARPSNSATPSVLRRADNDAVLRLLASITKAPVPLVEDPDLLWRNQPSMRRTEPVNPRHFGHDDVWSIETDSQGFRGPEIRAENSATYRILCVGDSITFGFNVDQSASFANRLEETLRARFPGRQFEVINAGVPGWSWLQGLRFLELWGLGLHPDLVIAAHGMNDQFWQVRVTDSERLLAARNSFTRRFSWLARALMQTNMYRTARLLSPPPEEDLRRWSPGCREQMGHGKVCHRASIPEIEKAVIDIHHLTAAAGAELLILNFDFLELGGVRGSQRATEKEGIPFVDFVAEFDQERQDAENARAAGLNVMQAQKLDRGNETRRARSARGEKSVTLRVLAPDAAARISVKGESYLGPVFNFDEIMYDDGTHGDEVAADRVFTLRLGLPSNVRTITYRFVRDQTAEFESVGSLSGLGDRLLDVDAELVAPVEVFGEMYHMAERSHPDAGGHAVIAERLAHELERFDSLRRFVGRPAS